MLLEKPITEGDVVSIKLINGDEIIARLEKEDQTSVTINRPLALTMSGGGLGMIPWIFLGNKETITLKREHYFVMVPSKKDAADQYMQGTTGIALV
jgi:copper(I)-binding protein